jgi:hypothetical protein
MLFTAVCGACHVMYGQGGKIGPDLTGSGRCKPRLPARKHRRSERRGQRRLPHEPPHAQRRPQLSGVIAESNDRTLTLRTVTETLTLDRADITKQETSPMSMMPEGLLLAFQPDQVRDLIAYLMHPVQVPMPKATP